MKTYLDMHMNGNPSFKKQFKSSALSLKRIRISIENEN